MATSVDLMEQLWLYCYQVEQSPQLCDIVGCRGTHAPCKQSLLPAFQGEIPRYRITVRLDAEALTLTDRQQVPYTNNESSKSVGLKPLRGCGSPARRALPF